MIFFKTLLMLLILPNSGQIDKCLYYSTLVNQHLQSKSMNINHIKKMI